MSNGFDFTALVELCRQTHDALQARVVRVADTSLAARNWLLGWYIVEYEQQGADRAAYGSALLEHLSDALGKGFSVRSLRQFRAFYVHRREIRQTLSAEFLSALPALADNATPIWQALSAEWFGTLTLGWSHYVELLTIEREDERRFYEIRTTHDRRRALPSQERCAGGADAPCQRQYLRLQVSAVSPLQGGAEGTAGEDRSGAGGWPMKHRLRTAGMPGRIRQLAERYAAPLPKLTDEVAPLAARVDGHLKKMGASWT